MRYLFLFSALVCASALGAPVQVPGTRVTLDVPPSFSLAADFPGFVSRDLHAAISISELRSSFVEANATYDDAALKLEGMEVVSRETFERDGLRALLIGGEQTVRGRRVAKLLLLTGDVADSLLITATYLKKDQDSLGSTLRKSLREATWDPSDTLDHFGGLQFRLDELPGLRVAARASSSVIFTQEGRLPDQYYTGAMLVVGWSSGDVATVKDNRSFAHKQFNNIGLLDNAEIEKTDIMTLDGQTAIVVTGSGKHRHLGYDLKAYQVIVTYKDRYLIAQGLSGSNDADAMFEQFRTIMSSLTTP